MTLLMRFTLIHLRAISTYRACGSIHFQPSLVRVEKNATSQLYYNMILMGLSIGRYKRHTDYNQTMIVPNLP